MKTILLTTAIFLGFTMVNGQTKETTKKSVTPVKNVITTSEKPTVKKSTPTTVSTVRRAPKKITKAMPADKARVTSSSPAQKTKMVSSTPKSRTNPSGQINSKTEEQKYTEDRINAKYKIQNKELIEKRKKEKAEKQKTLKNK